LQKCRWLSVPAEGGSVSALGRVSAREEIVFGSDSFRSSRGDFSELMRRRFRQRFYARHGEGLPKANDHDDGCRAARLAAESDAYLWEHAGDEIPGTRGFTTSLIRCSKR